MFAVRVSFSVAPACPAMGLEVEWLSDHKVHVPFVLSNLGALAACLACIIGRWYIVECPIKLPDGAEKQVALEASLYRVRYEELLITKDRGLEELKKGYFGWDSACEQLASKDGECDESCAACKRAYRGAWFCALICGFGALIAALAGIGHAVKSDTEHANRYLIGCLAGSTLEFLGSFGVVISAMVLKDDNHARFLSPCGYYTPKGPGAVACYLIGFMSVAGLVGMGAYEVYRSGQVPAPRGVAQIYGGQVQESQRPGPEAPRSTAREFVVEVDCSAGGHLGLELDSLRVVTVDPGGLVAMWNGGRRDDQPQLEAGDSILAVNGRMEPSSCREQLQAHQVLRLVARKGAGAPAAAEPLPRADGKCRFCAGKGVDFRMRPCGHCAEGQKRSSAQEKRHLTSQTP